MPRTDIIREAFNGHWISGQLDTALEELETAGLAACRKDLTEDAPREL